MSKRKIFKTNPLRKYIIASLLLFFVIGIGYSVLSTNLNITSIISIDKYDHSLYGVLEKAAKKGTYAQEYTGAHQDSMNELLSTKKIYHWYADDSDEANEILEKNNVLFGGFCWQMYRTTDTGGVRLVYNGTPNNGVCNRTGSGQQISTSSFNSNYKRLNAANYMYNNSYYVTIKGHTETMSSSTSFSTSYYYADSYHYDSATNKYTLVDPIQVTSDDYDILKGMYTFRSSSTTYSSSTIYYITKRSGNTLYYLTLSNGNDISYYNDTYTYGSVYTDNGDGTYTVSNSSTSTVPPYTKYKSDYYDNRGYIEGRYVCKNIVGDTCTDLWYANYSDNTVMYYTKISELYKFANSFTYDENTGTYTLSGDSSYEWNFRRYYDLYSRHYTCLNTSGECSTIYYIHSSWRSYSYYHSFSNGKSIEDVVNEMLYDNDVNTTNSTIKTSIDNWYANNFSSYSTYLEDTIFCYDRTNAKFSTSAFNPNATSFPIIEAPYTFGASTDLTCLKDTDKFSLNNSKARLTYPIGLAIGKEFELLGDKSLYVTGANYWLGSPCKFEDEYTYNRSINSNGITCNYSGTSNGVRPVVSLKPGTEYTSGDGSKNNPYVIG